MSDSLVVAESRAKSLKRVVVLGAGYAGLLAALRLAGRVKGRAAVTLINDRPHFVERVRLHQLAAGQPIVHRELRSMIRGSGIELVVGRATLVDPGEAARNGFVDVEPMHGERSERHPFDVLIYALGSGQETSSIEGMADHAHGINTEEQAMRLQKRLAELGPGAAITVIGGGLTAIEAASEIAESRPDLKVRLVAAGEIAPSFSQGAQTYMTKVLADLGIALMPKQIVERVTGRGVLVRGESASAAEPSSLLESDVVIACVGLGASRLAVASGLGVTRAGRLSIDETLRATQHPNIFGAGDGAAIASSEADFIRMACASAMPLGAHAADNVARLLEGKPLMPFRFAFRGQCVSLGRKHGLVQYVTADDQPKDKMHTGWLGARIKEGICRYTTISLALERALPGTYMWPKRTFAKLPVRQDLELQVGRPSA